MEARDWSKRRHCASLPVLGIGFEQVGTRKTLETRLEESEHLASRQSATSIDFSQLTRELRAATPVSIIVPAIYQDRKPSLQLRSRSRKSGIALKDPKPENWLQGSHISPKEKRPKTRPIPASVSLATIYLCEKTLIQRELLPAPHSLQLSYSLQPVQCQQGIWPTLPIHRSGPGKVKCKQVGWQLDLKCEKPGTTVKVVQSKQSKWTNSSGFRPNCPKYRIPIEFNLYRNVRKYAFHREIAPIDH